MTDSRVVLAGNLILDHFVPVDGEGRSTGAPTPPPADTPHCDDREIRAILETLPEEGVTVLPGGAPGNIRRILEQLDVAGEITVAMPEERRGISVTWYTPHRPGPLALRVSPPPPISAREWDLIGAGLDHNMILYLDGYAVPSLLENPGPDWFARAGASGARLLWDLAHPGVVAAHAKGIRAAIYNLAAACSDASGEPRATIFGSEAELAPLGGLLGLQPPRGAVDLVYKEPPAGASHYRLAAATTASAARVEPLARYRGPTVTPLETTGLGDAFVAGWIAGLSGCPRAGAAPDRAPSTAPDPSTAPLEFRLTVAHAAARRCAGRVGGTL